MQSITLDAKHFFGLLPVMLEAATGSESCVV
jgi:hypothetical protein